MKRTELPACRIQADDDLQDEVEEDLADLMWLIQSFTLVCVTL